MSQGVSKSTATNQANNGIATTHALLALVAYTRVYLDLPLTQLNMALSFVLCLHPQHCFYFCFCVRPKAAAATTCAATVVINTGN